MIRGLLARLLLLPLTFAAVVPPLLMTLISPRFADLACHSGKLWSRAMLSLVGARVTFEGHERLRRHDPCIVIANHQSMVDIWALLLAIPPTGRFAAKAELFRIPLFGWTLAATGFIPVDRGNRERAIRSLEDAARVIRGGRSVVLYPEGTRSRDGSLQPFKKGAFHLALAARVPVIPVAVSGAYDVMPTGTWRVTPGPVRVSFCEPIDVHAYADGDHMRLLNDVHAAIARELDAGDPAAPASRAASA